MLTRTHTKTYAVTHYANPYLACGTCGMRAAGFYKERPGPNVNWPCEHTGELVDVCPSWGPVDGCTCIEAFGRRDHGEPPMPAGYTDPLDGRNR